MPFKHFKTTKLMASLCMLSLLSACQLIPAKQPEPEPVVVVPVFEAEQIIEIEAQAEQIFKQFYQFQIDSSPVLRSTLALSLIHI